MAISPLTPSLCELHLKVVQAALDCVDRLLRDLCQRDLPFGGKIMLLGGDFRQILPVMTETSAPEVVANTILNHYTMRNGIFAKYSLSENMRLKRDLRDSGNHREWLLQVGEGEVQAALQLHPLAIPLPRHLCMPAGQPVEDLVRWAYPDLAAKVIQAVSGDSPGAADAWFRERAILTPRNDEARRINEVVLNDLDASTEFISVSLDRIKDPEGEDSASFPEEFLHTLQPSGFPPHKLRLRAGAVVILLRNLDKGRGLCNGVRMLVLKTGPKILDVRVISGPAAGSRVFLPRIPFLSKEGEMPFLLRRRQFPVTLAWAMTIHKAQGQSLAVCGVLLERPVFTHGQLYVSASRATSAGGLKFWLGEEEGHGHDHEGDFADGPHTHNVVFRSIFELIACGSSGPTSGPAMVDTDPDQRQSSPSTQRAIDPSAVEAYVVHEGWQEFQEHEELKASEEDALHRRLNHPRFIETMHEDVPSCGAVLTIDSEVAGDLVQQSLDQRAQSLGFSASEWWEISQRPIVDQLSLLQSEEAPLTVGAASSGAGL